MAMTACLLAQMDPCDEEYGVAFQPQILGFIHKFSTAKQR